ncbi:MAG: dockerin type I repeat-containing protein, partial [Clostridia bacterium]|nr:dockerin type I repeat-containing protein [Clostridia bacterium]
ETRVQGDLDGDGDVTVSDALAALRIAAKLREADSYALSAGDLDGDEAITVTDALAILRDALGLTR